jgi:EmrB/QacA subfamily drug resistance transporter
MTDTSDRKRWWVLFIMTGSLSMIMIDTTILTVALPPMQVTLGIDGNMVDWVLIAYILVLASLMALGGYLGDRIGKPRAFVIGTIGFGIASVFCGLAWDAWSLIAFRVLQGIFAVIMQPSSSALVIGAFAPGERGKAMGIYAGTALLFMTIGPVVGGLITEYLSWRYCFFVNLPVAITVATAAILIKPDDVKPQRRRFDWWGVLFLVSGLPALTLGIKQGNELGWYSAETIALIGGGLMLLLAFVITELKSEHPIVQIRLFKDRAFLGDSLMLMLTQAAVTGVMIYLALYLQFVMGFSPARAGIALMPMMIPVLFVMYFAGRTYDRRGARLPATVGAIIVTCGLAVLAVGTSRESYGIIMIGMIGIGIGVPFIQVPSNTDGMSRVDPLRRGMASGVLQTFRQFGSTIGLAVIAAVISSSNDGIDAGEGGDSSSNLAGTITDGITSVGTANGIWTAAGIAATIIIVAPLTLSKTPGRDI